MTYYLVFLALFWIFAFLEQLGKKNVWLFSFVLFILIAGLRFETGWDWMTYELYFNSLNDVLNRADADLKMELGFNLFIYLIKSLGLDFQFFLFFISLVTSAFIVIFLIKTAQGRIALAFAVIYSFLYLALNMTMIRQTLSCAIMCASIFFLMKKQLLPAAFFWISACFFHSSSLIFFVLFFYVLFDFKRRLIIKIYLGCLVFGFISFFLKFGLFSFCLSLLSYIKLGLISDKASIYLSQELNGQPSLGGLFYLIFNVCFGIYHQSKFFSKEYTFKVESFFILLISLSMGFFLDFAILWSRLQFFSIVIIAIVLARVIDSYQHKQQQSVIFMVTLLLSVTVHIYQLQRPKMAVFFPYHSVVHQVFDSNIADGRIRYQNLSE